ncbi:MAG: hypothetical protein P4L90_07760 [Rhodopila sp.]|nr:hypothetical protein [Rhodopila sp.]
MRMTNHKKTWAVLPAVVAAAGALAAAMTLKAMTVMARATPHVGDIIAFAASLDVPIDNGTRLLVHRQDRFGCVLDLNILRHSGGSLVVESQIAGDGRNFRLHWAGERTSADTGNCGGDADLIADHRDLDILAKAAGALDSGKNDALVSAGGIVE